MRERYGPEGRAIGTVARNLAAALRQASHPLSVLTPDDGGPVRDEGGSSG